MSGEYVQREDVDAVIPAHILVKALDDDGDGEEDNGLWEKLAAKVQKQVDGYLAARFSLPLPSIPDLISSAALTLVCETIYDRAGFSDQENPWSGRAKGVLALLQSIMKGDLGIGDGFESAHGTSGIVSEPSKTYNGGRLMV